MLHTSNLTPDFHDTINYFSKSQNLSESFYKRVNTQLLIKTRLQARTLKQKTLPQLSTVEPAGKPFDLLAQRHSRNPPGVMATQNDMALEIERPSGALTQIWHLEGGRKVGKQRS